MPEKSKSQPYLNFFNNDSQKSNYSPKSILHRELLFRHQNLVFVFAISSLLSPPRLSGWGRKTQKKAIWCPVYSVWILPVPSLASLLSSNNHHECNCWAGCPCKCHQHPRQEFLCQYLLFWGQDQPNSKHQQLASRRLALAVAEEKRQKNRKNIMVRKIPFYFKR